MEKEEFIRVCEESDSMLSAAATLGIHFNTLKRKAIKYGCYRPNQARHGVIRDKSEYDYRRYKLSDILEGKHPQYQTYKLKIRLIDAGLVENKCGKCGISEWNEEKIAIELDHIDGNRTNHLFENLRMLCPNCHSQTPTYRSKNIL